MTCSLHTNDAGKARTLSRCLYLRAEDLFGALECAGLLGGEDVADLVKDFDATILAQDDRADAFFNRSVPSGQEPIPLQIR